MSIDFSQEPLQAHLLRKSMPRETPESLLPSLSVFDFFFGLESALSFFREPIISVSSDAIKMLYMPLLNSSTICSRLASGSSEFTTHDLMPLQLRVSDFLPMVQTNAYNCSRNSLTRYERSVSVDMISVGVSNNRQNWSTCLPQRLCSCP
jgi:hypothetical protein